MSKAKKVTFNMIAAGMNAVETMHVQLKSAPGIELDVKVRLSMKEAMAFIKDVVLSCINMDDMEYTPEALDFAMRVGVLHRYAGVDTPKSLDKAWDVVYGTGILDEICACIDLDQLKTLEDAANSRITYLRDMQVALAGDKMQKLFSRMEEMVGEGAEIIDRASEIDVQKLERMVSLLQQPVGDGAAASRSGQLSANDNASATKDKVIHLSRKGNG